jgi:ribonuclease HI
MEEENINWRRTRLKKNKVWLATDSSGSPIQKSGKVLIKYQIKQPYQYWVKPENVRPLDSAETDDSAPDAKPPDERHAAGKPPAQEDIGPADRHAIRIYTDGAASGNPGPAGIGVVLQYGAHEKEISRYIGETTNNIAELEAIRTGLLELKKKELPVRIFTDSSYAHGVLSLGWKARKNQEVVSAIRDMIRDYKDLKLIKVRGHAGHTQNEQADKLARSAIKNRNR